MRRLAARTAHAALAAQAAPCTRGLSASAAAQRSAAQRAAAPLEPPAEWYPAARAARRRIILHVGPPNSGKTHAALAALCAAPSGTYCAPLRLLAWEAAERVAAAGTPCSLLTGQERRKIPGARHVACTVEMADVAQPVAVAVIDEIQLLADPRRGWAFTRALLGVPADEVHVCGDGAAAALVAALAADAGETVEVVRYERLLPLRAARAPLRDVGDVRAGDALVAFSRREVHALRAAVEDGTQQRCCILYGGLPPAVRAAQAAQFNAPRSGYGVLASSDVIGMGLNLSIKRVVFASLHKFDGSARRLLTAPEVRQIAGRAGRYGGRYAAGEATTLAEDDLPLLHAALAAPPVELSAAGVFPPSDAILAAAAASPRDGLEGALRRLAAAPPSAPHYAQHQPDDVIALAKLLAPLALPLPAALTLALAPCDAREPAAAAAMLRYATALADGRPVRVDTAADVPLAAPRTQAELAALEEAFRTFDLYVWLSLRMPEEFGERVLAEALRDAAGAAVQEGLRQLARPPASLRAAATRAREGRAAMQRASDAVAAAAAAAAMPPRRGRAAWLHIMPREWTREWDAADAAALEDAAPAAKEAAVGLHAATSKVPPPPLPRLVRRAAAAAAP